METPSIETITAILRKHRNILYLEQIEQVELALIGQGEANINLLVTVNRSHRFNIRIGLRGKESERTLQSEFEVLQLLPSGIGPGVFALDFSQTHLPQPYLLLQYITGALKKTWDLADLQLHAHTLARLHQRKFDGHGPIGQLSEAPYDFLYRFDVALNYWQSHHPYLLEIPVVQRLFRPIRHFIVAHRDLFMALRHFTIVHGDLHPLNILFNGDQLCYIDWEMAAIGDPALDVSMIGWDIETSWQMELTGDHIRDFLDTYLALEPDDTLPQRREVWMIYTMFFDQLYHRTQIPNDVTGRQLYTVQQIESYLTQRFL
jgi:aminoglycoside phosphotransferase (APT) family kinase protein